MSLLATPVYRERERVERRVLGALRCVDASTGAALAQSLRVEPPVNATVRPNRSGLLVVHGWAPLAAHAAAFEAPPPGAPGSAGVLELALHDPSGQYLARRVRLPLPRDADPARAHEVDALFQPLRVPMYRAPSAGLSLQWAALRVSLAALATGDALGGVLLRVVRDGTVLARGLSDWRGEALVPVVGIPVTTWSTEPGAVVVNEIAATLEAIADPARTVRTPLARVRAGLAPSPLPLADPAAIESARAGLPQASAPVMLAAGRPLHLSLGIALP
jgi:hypothetical protein